MRKHLVAGAADAADGIQNRTIKVEYHKSNHNRNKNSNFTAMNPKTLISLSGAVISNPLRRLAAPVDFELLEGECIALTGPNGSGKSTVLEMLRGGFYLREGTLRFALEDEPYRAIRTVEFDNAYSTSETQYYYQQRWQAFEREASPLAGELLEPLPSESAVRHQLFEILDIAPLLGKEIITLSSGELRRFSIARALLKQPQVLILENPFIGLDPPTRDTLCRLLEQINRELGISIVMTQTDADRIPAVVTHVYFMESGRISSKIPAEAVRNCGQKPSLEVDASLTLGHSDSSLTPVGVQLPDADCSARNIEKTGTVTLPQLRESKRFDKVVEMRRVNIAYGDRQIFKELDWTVRSGEKWNVTGPNGSGKSTLLSLVNADNPRAYSLDITLFDRRRGTGESIWDIKRHIGFLSSEMHSGFITSDTVLEIIRGGLEDKFGGGAQISGLQYNTQSNPHHEEGGYIQQDIDIQPVELHAPQKLVRGICEISGLPTEEAYLMRWLRLFGAEDLANRRYNTLSSGEQRYILLIRAFVKDPDLLILGCTPKRDTVPPQ